MAAAAAASPAGNSSGGGGAGPRGGAAPEAFLCPISQEVMEGLGRTHTLSTNARST